MANITDQSPYIFDTVANNIVTGPLWISKIRWVTTTGGVAGTDVATLKDGNGKTIWSSVNVSGAANLEIDTYPMPRGLFCAGDVTAGTGIGVVALTHGKLYIYIA